jgi:carbon storage regulator
MLVLTRKPGEKIHVGPDITVTVLEVVGNKIRIGIEAPEDIRVLRSELLGLPDTRLASLGKVHETSS